MNAETTLFVLHQVLPVPSWHCKHMWAKWICHAGSSLHLHISVTDEHFGEPLGEVPLQLCKWERNKSHFNIRAAHLTDLMKGHEFLISLWNMKLCFIEGIKFSLRPLFREQNVVLDVSIIQQPMKWQGGLVWPVRSPKLEAMRRM